MKRFAMVLLTAVAGCGSNPDVPINVTSRAPNTTFNCISPRLNALPLRYDTYRTADGWRMDVLAYSGPPAGWYRKGTIEHSDNAVVYAPDSANRGIAMETPALSEIRPILRKCAPLEPIR